MEKYFCKNCSKELPYRRSTRNKYCNHICQQEHAYNLFIERWKNGLENGRRGKFQTSNYVKRYVLEKQKNSCAICGLSEWNFKPITLELDHINGVFCDNSEENLRCVCPNCHSQTETFKAKNKGNGRSERK